ncbi:MAG: hypothetical protein HOP15_07320 [Planctomycetes bacterium]|nr:hypothetical protein [Planctomycetota bacterium]
MIETNSISPEDIRQGWRLGKNFTRYARVSEPGEGSYQGFVDLEEAALLVPSWQSVQPGWKSFPQVCPFKLDKSPPSEYYWRFARWEMFQGGNPVFRVAWRYTHAPRIVMTEKPLDSIAVYHEAGGPVNDDAAWSVRAMDIDSRLPLDNISFVESATPDPIGSLGLIVTQHADQLVTARGSVSVNPFYTHLFSHWTREGGITGPPPSGIVVNIPPSPKRSLKLPKGSAGIAYAWYGSELGRWRGGDQPTRELPLDPAGEGVGADSGKAIQQLTDMRREIAVLRGMIERISANMPR